MYRAGDITASCDNSSSREGPIGMSIVKLMLKALFTVELWAMELILVGSEVH